MLTRDALEHRYGFDPPEITADASPLWGYEVNIPRARIPPYNRKPAIGTPKKPQKFLFGFSAKTAQHYRNH